MGLGALGLIAVAVYWILIGGTDAGVVVAPVRAINTFIAGACIWLWVRTPRYQADRIDTATLLALLCFVFTAVLSMFPRASLDAAGAAVAWTAALFVGRRLASRGHVRRFSLQVLGLTGIVVALLFALLWGLTWARWLTLTNFESWPPLSLALPTLVFRHPHVVAFTAVVLAPAVVSLWQRPILRPMVVLTIAATAFLAFASGSRTIWLAALLASGLTSVLLLKDREVSPRRSAKLTFLFIVALVIVALVILAVVWQLGIGQQVIDRITTTTTLGARGQIWQGALHAWAVDPLTGSGPGTFVQALPLSGYFQWNAFAPRHADNGLIQLLSEGGLVAVAGAAVGASIVATSLWKSQIKSAIWAVAFFAISTVTDNPTDTAGLNAIAIWWIALAIPAAEVRDVSRLQGGGWPVRKATLTAFSVVAIGYVSLTGAVLAHDSAIRQAAAGDLSGARNTLRLITALDPGSSLYLRELGIVELAMRNPADAVGYLRQARAIVPTDDLTGRALAVAELEAGDRLGSVRTIEITARGSPAIEANLLLQAWILGSGDADSGRQHALLAIQRNPLLTGAPSWRTTFAEWGGTDSLLSAALDDLDLLEGPTRLSYQPMWLRAMADAGSPSISDLHGAAGADLSGTSRAWVDLLNCDVSGASRLLQEAQAVEGDSGLYWFVRIVAASAGGEEATAVRRLGAMVSPIVASRTGSEQLSPLRDPAYDRRMYGRASMPLLSRLLLLPSSTEARSHWMLDPYDAADIGAPDSGLARCR